MGEEEQVTAPKLICVTPARNEAWIIERFLQAAELWADHVVLADQGSTDETVAIARQFNKVEVVRNPARAYDEGARQRLLLAAARQFPGPRVIIALDADEFLTPNWTGSDEWREAISAPPGTVLRFDWVNVLPDGGRAWIPPGKLALGFVDDGRDHDGPKIHATRIPVAPDAPARDLREVKVLHWQYTDWPRMKSKQRWYQCWERVHHPRKRPVQIYRQYHRMDAFPPEQIQPVDASWIGEYARVGIDLKPTPSPGPFWWDAEVLRWITEHGVSEFARLDLWDADWHEVARQLDVSAPAESLCDPRGRLERRIHAWLRHTQGRAERRTTRWCQRVLIPLGW
jgi:Glycosyl transferase family 2